MRGLVVIVGGRLTIRQHPDGVAVVMTERLLHHLRSLRPELDHHEVDTVYATANRSTTWTVTEPR